MNATPELDGLLRLAASGDHWDNVIHRCAWCQRIFDQDGVCTNLVAFDRAAVVTDGMCAACGAAALARLAGRHARQQAA